MGKQGLAFVGGDSFVTSSPLLLSFTCQASFVFLKYGNIKRDFSYSSHIRDLEIRPKFLL